MLAPILMLALASPTAGPEGRVPAGAWILRCDMPPAPSSPPRADPVRVFRLAPKVFQEWQPDRRTFGPNLCLSFPCRADMARLEGVIESRTLVVTIAVDRSRRSATWRTTGASGLSRTQGACDVRPESKSDGPVA